NVLEVFTFVLPVRDKDGDIRPSEVHFGMVTKHSLRNCWIVLGAHGENDPALFELLSIALQRQMRLAPRTSLAEHDSFWPIVTDHAAPKSIIEVEDQAFL